MKKAIKILSISLNGENNAILTEGVKGNPTGVFKQTRAQIERLAKRAGVFTGEALKHLAELGGATLEADEVECKAGEAWTSRDGKESGKYEKDHIQYQNTEVKLGFAAKMKVAEIAFTYGMNRAEQYSAPVIAPVVAEAPKVG